MEADIPTTTPTPTPTPTPTSAADEIILREHAESLRISRRSERIIFYQGDDEAAIAAADRDIEDLRARLRQAREDKKDAVPRLMTERDPVADLTGELDAAIVRHDDLVAQAKRNAVVVTVVALGRKQWRALTDVHPPREGNEGDQRLGFNEETLGEELVPLSIGSPTFGGDAEREEFLDSLSSAQYERLYLAAYACNRGVSAAPKAIRGSLPSPNGAATSA